MFGSINKLAAAAHMVLVHKVGGLITTSRYSLVVQYKNMFVHEVQQFMVVK